MPLALSIARTDPEAWDRVLFELFPDWLPGEDHAHAEESDEDGDEDDAHDYDYAPSRTTQELLLRLRKQVPSRTTSRPAGRPSLGEDIFA